MRKVEKLWVNEWWIVDGGKTHRVYLPSSILFTFSSLEPGKISYVSALVAALLGQKPYYFLKVGCGFTRCISSALYTSLI